MAWFTKDPIPPLVHFPDAARWRDDAHPGLRPSLGPVRILLAGVVCVALAFGAWRGILLNIERNAELRGRAVATKATRGNEGSLGGPETGFVQPRSSSGSSVPTPAR